METDAIITAGQTSLPALLEFIAKLTQVGKEGKTMNKRTWYLIPLAVVALSYPLIIDNLFLSADIHRVMLALLLLPVVIALMWILSRTMQLRGG